jgi:ATP synthase F1 delta subunit
MVLSRMLVLVAAAAGAANLLSKAFVSPRATTVSTRFRAGRVAMQADMSGLTPTGPLIAYMNALMDAAAKQGESVAVVKDVMKMKLISEGEVDPKVTEEFYFAKNSLPIDGAQNANQVTEADLMIDKYGPWESTVFPKFIKFLAKKTRLPQLAALCQEYVANLYVMNSIMPVIVTSAQKLTEEQANIIKDKMAEKIGVKDVKLIQRIDQHLVAGFKVEWGFTDPERLDAGSEMLDLTFKSQIQRAAVANTR